MSTSPARNFAIMNKKTGEIIKFMDLKFWKKNPNTILVVNGTRKLFFRTSCFKIINSDYRHSEKSVNS